MYIRVPPSLETATNVANITYEIHIKPKIEAK